ncbi:MAG: Acyl-coenzyme A:6-aminopenicillanic acid acyl-transferase [Planctomycetota bacterium]|nr:Acyl-coenzyme A:6-aminopenicillanic acid acyl-transferase [Planctomycetota bacterium]
MMRTLIRVAAIGFFLTLAGPVHADTHTIARCGQGFLEDVDGYRVLHVKGTPYEMGFQQGALLKEDIKELVHFLFDVKAKELKIKVAGKEVQPNARAIIAGIAASQKKFVPARFFEELKGVADGAGMSIEDITVANFIPEMFHCSGFALSGSATKDGTLYHGRVLDYGCDWRLQEHAVLTIAEPDGKIPFVNVTYAGFIGSVTGMNAKQVSIGEMGGAGLGHWAGVPMSFLVRMALEEADDLDEAVSIFRDNPRTCEYYYVVADGKTGKGVGMEACWDRFNLVQMGESHARLPHGVKDAVLLSAGDRYEELARRVKAGHGTFDATSARELMSRPVAMKSNLHSVLFETKSSRLWVANASKDGQPAASQPYHAFRLSELLTHKAGDSATTLPASSSGTR